MRIFLVKPTYFNINYEINPWMNVENKADIKKALAQWENLVLWYEKLGVDFVVIDPKENKSPDMVFVANAGCVFEDKFILSHFKYKERRSEESFFKEFFEGYFNVVSFEKEVFFEGQGDAFFACDHVFLGYDFRSSKEALGELQKYTKAPIIQLKLINPNFYHLDTALAYIGKGVFLAVKSAFLENDIKKIKKLGDVIFLSDVDAKNFAANCIVVDNNILLYKASEKLKKDLKFLGFNVIEVDVSEFLKSGGSVRCMSLVV